MRIKNIAYLREIQPARCTTRMKCIFLGDMVGVTCFDTTLSYFTIVRCYCLVSQCMSKIFLIALTGGGTRWHLWMLLLDRTHCDEIDSYLDRRPVDNDHKVSFFKVRVSGSNVSRKCELVQCGNRNSRSGYYWNGYKGKR